MTKSDFTKMCNPAKLYLAVSIVVVIYGMIQQFSLITLGTNFVFSVLWTMVLNWLCSVGLKTVSWILVLLPYLMMFLSAGFILDAMRGKKEGLVSKSTSIAHYASPSMQASMQENNKCPPGQRFIDTMGCVNNPYNVACEKGQYYDPHYGCAPIMPCRNGKIFGMQQGMAGCYEPSSFTNPYAK
jgi:hypothetical protein